MELLGEGAGPAHMFRKLVDAADAVNVQLQVEACALADFLWHQRKGEERQNSRLRYASAFQHLHDEPGWAVLIDDTVRHRN